tara:strand:- start:781 stop:984 length:204 start_codon:yes stop_codon:yes gene_type:complete
MSKAHRGTPLKEERPNSGRGKCPVTGQTGVKLVYEHEIDGQKVMISKIGKSTLANQKRREEAAAKTA